MAYSDAQQMFAGSGGGGPSFKFGNPGDTVQGTILSMAKVQQVDFSTQKPVVGDDGQPVYQVQIVLQTDLRGWQGVSKMPTDMNGQPRNPAEDDGKRAIYAKGVMLYAIGEACRTATGQPFPVEGAWLAVRYTHTAPSPRNPVNTVKHYQAVYQAPPSSAQQAFGAPPQQAPTPPPSAPQQPQQPSWGPAQGAQQAPPQAGPQQPQQPSWGPAQGAQQAPPQAGPQQPQQGAWGAPPAAAPQQVEQGQWGAPMTPQQVAQAGYGAPQQDPWGAPPAQQPGGFGQGNPPF